MQMVFHGQLVTVFFQPVFVYLVIGHDGGHLIPEIFGMVQVGQVTELMHHHIIQHFRGSEDETVVIGQCPPGGTAAPACLLIPNGDGGVAASGDGPVVSRSCLQSGPGGIFISFFHCLKTLGLCLCEIDDVLLLHVKIIAHLREKTISFLLREGCFQCIMSIRFDDL